MRSEAAIISLILTVAAANDAIRAVLLTGSRANPNARRDRLQDFDVIYVVTQIASFTQDHSWVNVFGERLIMQMPDAMEIGEKDPHASHYLMLFADGNRIDLTLFPLDKLHLLLRESLLQLLLDKDGLMNNLPPPTEANYIMQPPEEKAFKDCCNEFWWVSTYVAKGLWRNEIIFAKTMLEGPVRKMFLQILEWHIGVRTGFTAAFNKGRNLQQYLSPEMYSRLLATYPGSDIAAIWNALFNITALFDELAEEIAGFLNFFYNKKEADNVLLYLNRMYTTPALM